MCEENSYREGSDYLLDEGFPKNLSDDVKVVTGLIPQKTYRDVSIAKSEQSVEYYQDGQKIRFPHRNYYLDIPDHCLDTLSEQQKMILHCIYSRNCDGYVRQKHLKSLLLMDYEDWAIPYIVKLCDEYVVEIVEMTYDILKEQDTESIRKFCEENRESFCKSYSRMTSYWNEYYRHQYSHFHQYVGRKLFRECFGYSKSMERS